MVCILCSAPAPALCATDRVERALGFCARPAVARRQTRFGVSSETRMRPDTLEIDLVWVPAAVSEGELVALASPLAGTACAGIPRHTAVFPLPMGPRRGSSSWVDRAVLYAVTPTKFWILRLVRSFEPRRPRYLSPVSHPARLAVPVPGKMGRLNPRLAGVRYLHI
ncbi:hypothetical protein GGS23DRAFT_556387 [Durotheca rogersii]|uniref:uncharacterized protein n=1 Tax=Durotheca rogersii TaxID=419775 RepID=UPI00221F72E5|nr:uncharacterized protein GGS23DRAFT_556387 [Durotheca rogersii]KAI5866283.1 hypothetical protein GGS23DRAFT_556387 [Durotheca rogersii]